jgi:cytochrome d ubiquinol oxidase subunit II
VITGFMLFPNLVRASNNPDYSITIYNSSSGPFTLKVMLIIALIGMPVVLAYTAYIYKIFRERFE